jgi:acyl-CoA dehydrogenase
VDRALFDAWLDESHHTLRRAARRFAREVLAPHAHAWEEAGHFPRHLHRDLAEAGLLAPSWPEDLGGGGGDVFHDMVVAEELIRAGSTGTVVGLASFSIALPPILALGSSEQHERFIRPVLAGEQVAALAITEPGTGSDVAGVRTRARREGDAYVLDGEKTYITSGARADLVTVLARTGDDPHGGLTFFVVEAGTPGFRVARTLEKTGWWASDTAELVFEGCRVPASNRIGPEGSGFVALMQNFEQERLMLAVNGHALAEAALEEALAWSRQREAFGRPLARFQVTRHKLARMATQVASAKALTYACAARMREGQRVMSEIAMAKNHAAEVARQVCWEAVQIHGGMGYMRETKVERWARDARLLPIGGGTTEIMNELIARGLGV